MKSIDKCSGEDCACKLDRKRGVRIIKNVRIESINIVSQPPSAPGTGFMQSIHMVAEPAMPPGVAYLRTQQALRQARRG